MGNFVIRKGFDIPLEGAPATRIDDAVNTPQVITYPLDFDGVKQRVVIEEGQEVKRGSVLIEDKVDAKFTIRAPAGGRIATIKRGARRFVEQVVIDVADDEPVETFKAYTRQEIASLPREEILDHLTTTGYLLYLRQRPFSRMAVPEDKPKSIFVNAMNTAPFRIDAGVVANDDPEAFQAGLDLMSRLTDGHVHLCTAKDADGILTEADNVQIHTFEGPHPAGNTSVHISRVDPMKRHDVVWTISAADLVLIGRLFLDGALPATRVISIGGPAVKPEARHHYRVRIGADLTAMLRDKLVQGENRIIDGDILAGRKLSAATALPPATSAITVLPEGREREFMGWLAPGVDKLSFFRTYASSWAGGQARPQALTSSRQGGHRAMVLTGQYDRVMPLNIMVDFLIRAVLAGDTTEAIKLGILETAPEDFALCDFICPCKTEVQSIIEKGLETIMEEEGIA